MKLYKTTIVVWTEYDPSLKDLDSLGQDAMDGSAYCSKQETVLVADPIHDSDFDGTEFFNID